MLIAIFAVVAVCLLVAGYLVRVRNKLDLLAGHDPGRVVDREGLARVAGLALYVMGLGTLAVPILMLFFAGDAAIVLIGVGYMVFVWAVVLTLVTGVQRYLK